MKGFTTKRAECATHVFTCGTEASAGSKTVLGFTLVETLVAITILTIAVLMPFQIVQNVVSASRLAKENLVASTLADEGLEYVRFIRTSNFLADPSGYDALDGINGTSGPNCTGANKCTLDATAALGSAFSICAGTCNPLYVTSTGLYTQVTSGNTKTLYTRSVSVAQNAGYETVTVTVSWTDKGSHTVTITENLYDWL